MTKYKKVTPEIAAQLQAIVGAKRFFAGDAVKDDFSHDEMPIYGKYYPEVVCEAESTEEVSAILRVCYENDIPVTPRGAGTGLVGGCVPLCGGVVLCTTRMNKILPYDTNNLVVQGSEDSFIAYYERLIDMLREQLNPGVTIYIQSIPGVQEDVVASKPGLDNTRIATVNDLLANMALRKGCYYINIREALTNPADGSQIDDYATKDGVHFNAAGYHAWAEYLATHTVWNRRSVYSGENPYYIYGT